LDGNCLIGAYTAEGLEKAWREVGPYFLYHQRSFDALTTDIGALSSTESQPGGAGIYRRFLSKPCRSVEEL
jgi:hypothetical protein